MKLFRIAGLLLIAGALFTGATTTAKASAPVTCWKVCSGHFYSGWCWLSLSECCQLNQETCPDPWYFEGGDCTDGQSYCP